MKHFAKKLAIWANNLEKCGGQLALEAAQNGAKLAQRMVPVDSGELRSGIFARQEANGAAVVSAAPHGAMVEFGTSRSGAQPYMQPMAEQMRNEFKTMAIAALKEGMLD